MFKPTLIVQTILRKPNHYSIDEIESAIDLKYKKLRADFYPRETLDQFFNTFLKSGLLVLKDPSKSPDKYEFVEPEHALISFKQCYNVLLDFLTKRSKGTILIMVANSHQKVVAKNILHRVIGGNVEIISTFREVNAYSKKSKGAIAVIILDKPKEQTAEEYDIYLRRLVLDKVYFLFDCTYRKDSTRYTGVYHFPLSFDIVKKLTFFFAFLEKLHTEATSQIITKLERVYQKEQRKIFKDVKKVAKDAKKRRMQRKKGLPVDKPCYFK